MKSVVSVIIPVYNTEKYIKRCIESVLEQTYKNIEIVLIDNGSNDKSYEICLEYSKQYSNIALCRQNTAGVSNARNMGIETSTGKYLFFLDSDDYIESNVIECLVNNMIVYNCDVIGVDFFEEDSNGEGLKLFKHNKEPEIFNIDSFGFFSRGVIGKLFKKKIIIDNKIFFNSDIHYAEDTLFLTEVYMNCDKIVILPKRMYHYVVHSKSATHKFSERNLSELEAWCVIADKLEGHLHTQREAKCQYCLNAMSLYIKEHRNGFDDLIKCAETKKASLQYRKEVLYSKHIGGIKKVIYWVYSLNPDLYIKILDLFKYREASK